MTLLMPTQCIHLPGIRGLRRKQHPGFMIPISTYLIPDSVFSSLCPTLLVFTRASFVHSCCSRWIVAQQQRQKQQQEGEDGAADERCASFHSEERGEWGCEHYRRNCKLKAACCGRLVTCRFCHDKVSDHTMDR